MFNIKEFIDNNVSKFVFSKENDIVVETVLYKYNGYDKRTVICCSTQCGCPVGCTFCGTGNNFIRNLSSDEIVYQVDYVINEKVLKEIKTTDEIKKFQIMFMSMGEPMFNFANVKKAIKELNSKYPNAKLLLSTVGLKNNNTLNEILEISKEIKNVGLQFSIHQANEDKRNKLIPYKNKLNLREIRDYGIMWSNETHRPVFLNYCIDGNNTSKEEINRLKDLFPAKYFYITFSVICNIDKENKLNSEFRDLDFINKIANDFLQDGYNVRVFDPSGQDTIGGGCGQLWFVQDFLKKKKEK